MSARKLKHACIIMASGMATRFGSNKLLATLGGKPLIQYVVEAASGVFGRCVAVTRCPDVAELCRRLGADVVLHDEPGRGDAVFLGMEALGECETVTFLQGDQPLIRTSSLREIVNSAEEGPSSIWRASFDGVPGAPVLFPAWAFDELRALPSGKGGGHVVRAHPEHVRCVEVADSWELFDVDTPDDLRILEDYLRL